MQGQGCPGIVLKMRTVEAGIGPVIGLCTSNLCEVNALMLGECIHLDP